MTDEQYKAELIALIYEFFGTVYHARLLNKNIELAAYIREELLPSCLPSNQPILLEVIGELEYTD